MKNLNLSSKANVLDELRHVLKSASILPIYRFQIDSFRKNKENILNNIQLKHTGEVIIRSSSANEDTELTSNAGNFTSIMNIDSQDSVALSNAIERVISSYGSTSSDKDEVLIQPMLQNVQLAGVIFTADIDTLSSYYVINYDDSGSTDSVTSGNTNKLKTYVSYRKNNFFPNTYISKIISATQECEKIFRNKNLDIEFAFSNDELFIFQVREIVSSGKKDFSHIDLTESLRKIFVKLNHLNHKHPNLLGDKAIFGVMPDWNPAEIIGLRPKKLALSLYKELITDEMWAFQRDDYGYRNLRSHPLLISLLGIPYVDVRVSFNSFIPSSLNDDIANKLVNFYISKLSENKSHHDKIEFEVIHSCYFFGIEKKFQELSENGFSKNDIDSIKDSLVKLTNKIIHPVNGLYKKDLSKIIILNKKFNSIMASNLSYVDKVYWLIKDAKRYGTLPFAGIARAGFIAMQFLNSFVTEEIFTREEYNLFMKSLDTVSKQQLRDRRYLTKNEFVSKYGHLRPGTYDILSENYKDGYDNYFSNSSFNDVPTETFSFSSKQIKAINCRLVENNLKVNFEEFITFIKESIEGREKLKFEFTKSLNQILIYVAEFGNKLKDENGDLVSFSKEDLAHLDIQQIINLYSSLDHRFVKDILNEDINKNKESYKYTQAVKLPSLITSPEDIYGFFLDEHSTNFVTINKIRSEVISEDQIHKSNLTNKIVCIRSADPGYDFLFSKNIGGLITCFGGANSHMSIRCSELGIPAAIGCGDRNFEIYTSSVSIELDAGNQKITILD